MARVRLPTVLRPLAAGNAVIEVGASDLPALAIELRARYPALAERVYDAADGFRDFVSVFVDGEDVRYLEGTAPIGASSEVTLLPAISGGARP